MFIQTAVLKICKFISSYHKLEGTAKIPGNECFNTIASTSYVSMR